LRELHQLGECAVTCHTHRLPDLANFEFETCYLSWDITPHRQRRSRHSRRFQFVEDDSELAISPLQKQPKSRPMTIYSIMIAMPATRPALSKRKLPAFAWPPTN